jgi:hypothetical protein
LPYSRSDKKTLRNASQNTPRVVENWRFNLLPAAFGLLGVIVGGFITGDASYLLDERRSKRQQQREERARGIEIKRAARIIDADLSTAAASAMFACKRDRYWDSADSPLKLRGWDDYGAILAPAVSSDAWSKILIGIQAVRDLNEYRGLDAPAAVGNPFPPLSPPLKPGVAAALNDILSAEKAIAPLCDTTDTTPSGP